MKGVLFLNNPEHFDSEVDYVAHLSGIGSKEELLNQLSEKLNMPSYYFGHNWDALSDSFKDFHWIEQEKIIIVHDEYPQLAEIDFFRYLNVLFQTILDWKVGEKRTFEVVFPQNVKGKVEQYFNQK